MTYPIVGDGSIEPFESRQMQFIGYINDVEVVRSNYSATADCCGVIFTSGDLNLTIEQ